MLSLLQSTLQKAPQASFLLVMMIVGGAVLPAIQGALMDVVGVRPSLAVVLIGYLYLVYFGFFGSRESQANRLLWA